MEKNYFFYSNILILTLEYKSSEPDKSGWFSINSLNIKNY